MIEIVLRKDIAAFEAKPFFGFTARQVLTGAAAGVVALGSFGLCYFVIGLPMSICGYVCMAMGAAVGFVGIGRVRGLKPESWLRITLAERSYPLCMTYARPVVSGCPQRGGARAKLARADRRALKAERLEYDPADLLEGE